MAFIAAHTPNALRAALVCTLALLCCATWAGDGGYRVVYAFPASAQSGPPSGSLMQASDGFLYGQTSHTHIYRLSLAGEFTALRSSNPEAGADPDGTLLEGQKGTFFGTWRLGAVRNGRGLVFSFKPGTGLSILHQFLWRKGSQGDGAYPLSGLVRADDGLMYGTTSGGGEKQVESGTVFRITDSGDIQIRHAFSRAQGHGAAYMPVAPLTHDGQGRLLGTTFRGGTKSEGTLWRIDAEGAVEVLHNFRVAQEGDRPLSALVQDPDGTLWGTTSYGGAMGCGTVYKLKPGGHLRAVHHFDPGISKPCTNDGVPGYGVPSPTLITSDSGVFYGTAPYGGQHGWGVVFKLRANGEFTVLHSFGEQGIDGRQPNSAPVLASDGFLYGTTLLGGADDVGTVYRIKP